MTTKPLIFRYIPILAVTAMGLMLAACQQAPPIVVAAPSNPPEAAPTRNSEHGQPRDHDDRQDHHADYRDDNKH
jgi:hypothetical protein